jgi:exopolysaccharide biosynthesis polyprenyl glycosylphosphotransferase
MELNRMVRDLHRHRVHVQLSSGISGIHHRRMRVQTVGCQPLIYVEPTRLSLLQSAAKRGLDIVGAIVGILVGAPLVMFAALVVKLGDRGPALFAQQRVGRDGRTFMMFKLRTMRVDAEERLRDLCDQNERDGPLFKITDDPRVTRVGRFLRATSIDELPQLLNVLAGSMSLVGPRPALPTEVDQFAHAEVRHAVRPGITGLWQVEARDSPSFNTYQRLDLFYVENWSVWLDLAVLLRTGRAVISRARRASSVARHPTGSFDSASATTSRRDCEPVAPKANGASASAPLACRDEGNTVQVATSTRAPPGGGAI